MQGDEWLVSRWMSKTPFTVKPRSPLVDAFELMHQHRIRHVPVVDHGKLVGIISDRDVRQAMPLRKHGGGDTEPAYGKAMTRTHVDTVMTRNPITVSPMSTVREAAEIICREKVGALPVMEDEKLVGIVSTDDLLWAFVEHARHIHAM